MPVSKTNHMPRRSAIRPDVVGRPAAPTRLAPAAGPDDAPAATTEPPATSAPTAEPPTSSPSSPASARVIAAVGPAAYAALSTRFGAAWADALSDEAAREEAAFHAAESDGFPGGMGFEEYQKHYASAHGFAAPQMPSASSEARAGRLKTSAVRRLGLIPLGERAPAGEERYYEPARVAEGAEVTARDGSVWRVTYDEGAFDVEPVSPPTQAPGEDQPDPAPSDASPPPARRPSSPLGVLAGVAGGLLAGAILGAVTAAVAKAAATDEKKTA